MQTLEKDTAVELTQLSFSESPRKIEKDALIPSMNNKMKPLKDFWLYLSLLLNKNYIITKRSWKLTLFQIMSPFIVTMMLWCWQNFSDAISYQIEKEPPIYPLPKLERCYYNREDPDNCTTLAYAVVGTKEPWMEYALRFVAEHNQLDFNKDFKYLGEKQPHEFNEYIKENMNHTQVGVIFCNGDIEILRDFKIPCYFERHTDRKLLFYTILYNATIAQASKLGADFQVAEEKDPVAAALKVSMDNGIVRYFARHDKDGNVRKNIDESKLPLYTVFTQDFPKTFFRFFVGADMTNRLGAFHYFIPYMVLFISTILDIVREKHKRLRQGLAVMGLTHAAYWVSWMITVSLLTLIVTINLLISGYAFKFGFFVQTPLPILFTLFFTFGIGMQFLAFFIGTLCSNLTTGYVVAYAVLLLGIVVEFILSNPYVIFIFYISDAPTWWYVFRKFLELYPAYSYSKIFADITMKSGGHYELMEGRWVKGPGYKYEDLDSHFRGMFPTTEITFDVPPARDYFWLMGMNIVTYWFLTWYFDNILSHNRGTSRPLHFFLQKSYWKQIFSQKKKAMKFHEHHHSDFNYDSFNITDSVKYERERVLENQRNNNECFGMRIVGLNKIYNKSIFRTKSSKEIHAVKDLYLEVDDGELLTLLGHNGAGKTTLIGVLTGLLNPNSGTAEICNYNIEDQMDQIRLIMGVCPQFDILWDELTAEEHLYMFSKLKRIPDHLIPYEIDTRLKEVNLLDVKKARAGTFSGGMKRRLSMAIAFTGNPKIVFLDEPTTGMDPKNRRYIWDLVLRMKKGRVIILTTHAMEEADILSDRIAVIVDGMLKCIGTPLYLKNRFGDGYRLSIVTSASEVKSVIDHVKTIIPSGKVLDSSGGSIIFGVPLINISELQSFFRIMENKDTSEEALKFKSKIKDWGLSHTTLEEVFMKVLKFYLFSTK